MHDKKKLILDYSMSGLEGGAPRVYKTIAPTIAARLWKEPWRILICKKKK